MLLAVLAGDARAAWSQTIVRGPYLQQGTSASVIVKWRTDIATSARVRYDSIRRT